MRFLFVRHGLKIFRRSPIRSGLYIVLIAALVALLSLELSVYVSMSRFLEDADRNYKTIARFEYLGERYPNNTVSDPSALAAMEDLLASEAYSHDAVLDWNAPSQGLAFATEVEESSSNVSVRATLPYRDEAVLLVQIRNSSDQWGNRKAVVVESLFSIRDNSAKMVNISEGDYELIPGRYYIVHGYYYSGLTSEIYFRLAPFTSAAGEATGYRTGEDSNTQVTETDRVYAELGESSAYTYGDQPLMERIAETYASLNQSLALIPTRDIEADLSFNQQRISISQGRAFADEEYESGANVALISEVLAKRLSLRVGDTLDLTMIDRDEPDIFQSYWAGETYESPQTVEIVGIFATGKDEQHHIYVPESPQFRVEAGHYGYTLGTAVLDNRSQDSYYAAVSDTLPPLVRMTIYDQGYSAVTDSFRDLARSTSLVLGISVVAGLLVLLLFAYMSVYRERENGLILLRLGASRRQVRRFFLYLPAMAAGIAVVIGAAIGLNYADEVNLYVAGLAESTRSADLRYSVTNLSVTKDMAYVATTERSVFWLTAMGMFTLAMIFCYFIGMQSMKGPRKKPRRVRRERRLQSSRSLRGGAVKYAGLSIVRSGARAILPMAAVFSSLLLLFGMSRSLTDTSRELGAVSETSEIRLYITDIRGEQHKNVLVDLFALQSIEESGLVDSVAVTMRRHYWYQGHQPADGSAYVEGDMSDFGTSGFGMETMMDQLMTKPYLVFTNDIAGSADFFYSSGVETTYMEGWSDSLFSMRVEDQEDANVAVLPTSLMERYGIAYGDRIDLLINRDFARGTGSSVLDPITVVGSYRSDGLEENIYMPLLAMVSPAILEGEEAFHPNPDFSMEQVNLDSALFTLKSAKLDALKDFLQTEGFSEVNRISKQRQFIVIADANHLMTKAQLTQRINYMQVLYPAIYVLTYLLALLIPFIMVLVRRREIAIMLQTGTQRLRVFGSFFLELVILAAVGLGLALLVSRLLQGGLLPAGLVLTRNFILCWLVSSLVSVRLLTGGSRYRQVGRNEV